jgi:RNA polymerase sigma factor (sigma-70 family)
MVLGVCRRALRDPNDAADAFQATFLVLVRKAGSVRIEGSLGRWLYGVSRRVAVRARRAAARRSAREVDGVEALAVLAPQRTDDDLPAILDEEIGRLPEKYRAAVILCDLEGLGQDEAARRLGCAVGTVKSRLSRGREKLRSRLVRRGVAPAVVALCGEASATEVPAAMAEATVKAAIGFAAGQAGVTGVASARVIKLTQGVLRAMLFTKMRVLFATVTAIAVLATGAGVLARQATAPKPQGEQAADREGSKAKDAGDNPGTVRAAPPTIEARDGKDEERLDRIDALRLDIELLTDEISYLKKLLSQQASSAYRFGFHPGEFVGRGGGPQNADAVEKALKQQQETLKQQQEIILEAREAYLLKSKELRRKQRELGGLLGLPRDDTAMPRQSQSGSVASRPSSPDQAKASPALEQRIRGIERKLDEVMEMLKELKR